MTTQVDQIQNCPTNGGYKYATPEEAEEGHKQKSREYYHNRIKNDPLKKEQYNAYHREYYRKKKAQQQLSQLTPEQLQLQQQQIQIIQQQLLYIQMQYQLQDELFKLNILLRRYLPEATIHGFQQFQQSMTLILEDCRVIDSQFMQQIANLESDDPKYDQVLTTRLFYIRLVLEYIRTRGRFPSKDEIIPLLKKRLKMFLPDEDFISVLNLIHGFVENKTQEEGKTTIHIYQTPNFELKVLEKT